MKKQHALIFFLTENEALKQDSFQLKETFAAFLSHQYINNAASSITENISSNDVLKFEKLLNYYDKNLKKHFNFFYNADITFHLNFIYFQLDQKKILFIMQYLKRLFKKI